MRRASWPVTQGDLRSHGDTTQCAHCSSRIGEEHADGSVCRKRTVVVRMAIEYVVEVPEDWSEVDVKFHRNESSWCAGNAQAELDKLFEYTRAQGGCVCNRTKYEFMREATEDDERACGVRVGTTEDDSDAPV
jgi:hypothetical protein